MTDLLLGQIVEIRQAELRAEGARSRLAALAATCGPSARKRAGRALAAGGHAVREWFRRGQLGPGEGACTTC